MKKLILLPLALVLLALTVGGQTQHGLDLTWTPSSSTGVAGQNVYRSTVSGGPYTKLTATALAPSATSYLDPVVDGNTYFYVVTAVSQGPIVIESSFSNQVTATAPGPQPNPQTGLAVKAQ